MFARAVALILLSGLCADCLAEWQPADGIRELDAVEQVLRKVSEAKLSPAQKKVAQRTVADVEHVLAELRNGQNLTKAEKKAKVKGAIEELQGLQSQWELASVEEALKKVVEDPHLGPRQLEAAKRVAEEVDAVVDEIESGKLKGEAQKKKVAFAIKELEGLEHQWANATIAMHVADVEQEIAAKKALLAKYEKELKLADLEKELLEKKVQLKHLMAEKDQAEAQEKQRQEDAAQQELVAKLLATAKAIAETRQPHEATKKDTKGRPAGAAAVLADVKAQNGTNLDKQAVIKAILADLKARAHNVSGSLSKMDAEEKKREADLARTIEAGLAAPTKGKKDAIARGKEVLKMLAKRERRSFKKARAVRESELQELDAGIRSIEKGDVAGLSKLMGQMQAESKALEAKAKNFLY